MKHVFKPVRSETKGWSLRDEFGNHITNDDGFCVYYRNKKLANNAANHVVYDTENNWFMVRP